MPKQRKTEVKPVKLEHVSGKKNEPSTSTHKKKSLLETNGLLNNTRVLKAIKWHNKNIRNTVPASFIENVNSLIDIATNKPQNDDENDDIQKKMLHKYKSIKKKVNENSDNPNKNVKISLSAGSVHLMNACLVLELHKVLKNANMVRIGAKRKTFKPEDFIIGNPNLFKDSNFEELSKSVIGSS